MTVNLPDLPVDTTNSPLLCLHHPLSIRIMSPVFTVLTCSPQRTIPTIPVSSLPQAAATDPVKLVELTNLRGYLRRTTNSNLPTSELGSKSITFCLKCFNLGFFVDFLIWLMIDDSAFLLASDGGDFGTMNVGTTALPYSMIPTPKVKVKILLLRSIFPSDRESRLSRSDLFQRFWSALPILKCLLKCGSNFPIWATLGCVKFANKINL